MGLCVGTRPDCVPEAALELPKLSAAGAMKVWLELGLQTAHDKTPETYQLVVMILPVIKATTRRP